LSYLFYSQKFNKIVNYFILKCSTKKYRSIFKELLNFFLKKLSLSSQKYEFGIRVPRSGIRKKTYSGSRIQGSKRHRIPDPHATLAYYFLEVRYPHKSHKIVGIRFFLLFLHDDRMIRIQEAQKHVDLVEPDPQHCLEHTVRAVIRIQTNVFSSKTVKKFTRSGAFLTTRSGKKPFLIPEPGVKKASDSESATLVI
jgi:hypothetical protein